MSMKIGFFGGSFDPVHNDHVAICKKFKEVLGLDKVIVMPAKISPFKKQGYFVSDFHRKEMLEIAFDGLDYVTVSDYELKKDGVSYTYETVKYLSELYKGAKLYMLIGLDSLSAFLTWKNPEQILEYCTLAVAYRKGFDFEKEVNTFKEKTNKEIVTFSTDGKISSTYVRNQLFLSLTPTDFIPEKVCDYIKSNGLYMGDALYEYVASKLKPSRLLHTAGVIALAVEYAKKLGESADNARIAGLLHDVAKYESAKDYPNCAMPSDVVANIEHQYLGAYVAEKVLNVKDEEVLNAIRYHSTGRPNMTKLEKIIFLADLLEPSRNYDEVEFLRNKVNEDFESGFKLCLKRLIDHLNRSNEQIFSLTLMANEYYNGKK